MLNVKNKLAVKGLVKQTLSFQSKTEAEVQTEVLSPPTAIEMAIGIQELHVICQSNG